jgi:DNA-binding response OmpR family regulator
MRANNIPLDTIEGQTRRVLVVDDDQAILDLFEDVLTRDGRFEIKTATTGYDAGMLTESFKPHLIILDFMLPDINGNIVCQRLRENPDTKDVKIIFVSGVINEHEIKGLLSAGGDAFLKKPFKIRELVEKMTELLGMPSGAADGA